MRQPVSLRTQDVCFALSPILFAAAVFLQCWGLGLFAFLPLFLSLSSVTAKSKKLFVLGYLFGILYFGVAFVWIVNVSIPLYLVVTLLESLYMGFFALGFRWLAGSKGILRRAAGIPSLWILIEFIRSSGFLGMPVALAGYALTSCLPLAQLASVTGIYGLSFFVILINTLLFIALRDHHPLKTRLILLGISAGIFLGTYLGGRATMEQPAASEQINVAIIQGNISPKIKWDLNFLESTINTHKDLTRRSLTENPSLVIWPETAVPCFLFHPDRRDVLTELQGFIRETRRPVLLGTQDLILDREGKHAYNLAVLFSGDGEIRDKYGKIKLIPFIEHAPFRTWIPALRKLGMGCVYSPGSRHTVFREGGHRFSVLICFEGLFPRLVRAFVREGAQWLVNITNDAPSLGTMRSYYAVNADVLRIRAIENRRSFVRAANNGISCVIDPWGRVRRRAGIFSEDAITVPVPLREDITCYTRWGDWIAVFALLSLLFSWKAATPANRKKARRKNRRTHNVRS